jgi:glycosyltransferase involved in cell wall biosynthesis
MKLPKVSVIMATKNDLEDTLSTLSSYLGQKYVNKELVVVDSSDDKLVLDKLDNLKIVYCPAKGVANAFNKALEVTSGDYLYMIGQGDTFVNQSVIQEIMDGVSVDKDTIIAGQINRVKKDGEVLYTTNNKFRKWQLLYKMAIPHQGLFTHRKFFERYGKFDEGCKYAMDYEILLRAYKEFPKVVQKKIVVANWVEGGIGQDNTIKVLEEYHRIRIKNKIAPVWLLNIIYWMTRVRYWFRNT